MKNVKTSYAGRLTRRYVGRVSFGKSLPLAVIAQEVYFDRSDDQGNSGNVFQSQNMFFRVLRGGLRGSWCEI